MLAHQRRCAALLRQLQVGSRTPVSRAAAIWLMLPPPRRPLSIGCKPSKAVAPFCDISLSPKTGFSQ